MDYINRKYASGTPVYYNDSAEYYYTNRKHNNITGVYYNDKDEYYYTNRKYNTMSIGITYELSLTRGSQRSRHFKRARESWKSQRNRSV